MKFSIHFHIGGIFLFKRILYLHLFFSPAILISQPFTFSDTYPVNNLDSLEAWLVANPTPSVERLKNVIRAERTYRFGYLEKVGSRHSELKEMAESLNSQLGLAAFYYCSGLINDRNWDNFNDIMVADSLFKALNDTSGRIQCLIGRSSLNYVGGNRVGSFRYADSCLKQADILLKQRFDAADFIHLQREKIAFDVASGPSSMDRIALSQSVIDFCERNPDHTYAIYGFKAIIARTYKELGNYLMAEKLYKEALNLIKPNQIHANINLYLFMSWLYKDWKRYDKHLEYLELVVKLRKKYRYYNERTGVDLFDDLKEEMNRRERYKEAYIYADSFIKYRDAVYYAINDNKLIELENQYKDIEKQKQINELHFKQKEIENRNRFILILFVIAAVVSVLFAFLWLRLRRTNAQLEKFTRAREQFFAIIAHDLRRPFHAFQEISSMVNYYLKRQDYQAIKSISQSIDESGLKIRQLLDNLLKWALSQKEEIPYKPEKLNLLSEINDVTSIYQTIFSHRKIVFKIDCPDPLSILADKNALEMILRNIISNAVSAVDNEKGVIDIQAMVQPNNTIELTVSDNGKGLNAAKIKAFEQVLANPNVGEVGQNGFGFGLVLIAKFAKRNGIKISFTSREGEGTSYKLILK